MKKQYLFGRGAQAIRALGVKEEIYACPICTRLFGREALKTKDLTLEHVPPKSLGGKAIILTCADCNNGAGHRYEHSMKDRASFETQVKGFLGKDDGMFGRFRMSVDGISLNVDILRRDGMTTFNVLEKSNNPIKLLSFKEELDRFQEGDEIKIETVKGYKSKNARLADLKTGFLALTAKLGYSYAFHPNLTPIREQILKGFENVYRLQYLETPEMPTNSIAVLPELDLFLVRLDRTPMILPFQTLSPERLNTRILNDIQGTFTAKVIEFPETFEAIEDHTGANTAQIVDLD